MWSELLHELLRQIIFKDVLKGLSLNKKIKKEREERHLNVFRQHYAGPHFEL